MASQSQPNSRLDLLYESSFPCRFIVEPHLICEYFLRPEIETSTRELGVFDWKIARRSLHLTSVLKAGFFRPHELYPAYSRIDRSEPTLQLRKVRQRIAIAM